MPLEDNSSFTRPPLILFSWCTRLIDKLLSTIFPVVQIHLNGAQNEKNILARGRQARWLSMHLHLSREYVFTCRRKIPSVLFSLSFRRNEQSPAWHARAEAGKFTSTRFNCNVRINADILGSNEKCDPPTFHEEANFFCLQMYEQSYSAPLINDFTMWPGIC